MLRSFLRLTSKMEDAHTRHVEEILTFFKANPETGLDDNQVAENQEKYGPNGRLKRCFNEWCLITYD